MGELLFFHFRVTNVNFINKKNSLNITVRMSVNPKKSIPHLKISKNLLKQYVLGLPRYAQKQEWHDVVSNRWEFIWSLFRGHIPLSARDIQVQSFNHLTFSYLKWCACSQMLAFLTSLKWKPFSKYPSK